MALKRKSLEEQAKENARATKGTKNAQAVLKEGTPLDHHIKQEAKETTVGINLGITKNMDNYESLRVDCWLSDTVKENETVDQAYARIIGVVDKTLQDVVASYIE